MAQLDDGGGGGGGGGGLVRVPARAANGTVVSDAFNAIRRATGDAGLQLVQGLAPTDDAAARFVPDDGEGGDGGEEAVEENDAAVQLQTRLLNDRGIKPKVRGHANRSKRNHGNMRIRPRYKTVFAW